MTCKEYYERLKEINQKRDESKDALKREYVEANRKFKNGDVITNGNYTLLVHDAYFTGFFTSSTSSKDNAQIMIGYSGQRCKKNGTPYERNFPDTMGDDGQVRKVK